MNNLQGGFLVVARVLEKETLKGFLLADTSYHLHVVPMEAIQRQGYLIPYLNAQYDAQYQTLVGTGGASLTDYPAIDKDFVLLKGNGIIVAATVLEAQSKKPIGVVAFNGIGTRFNLSYKKLSELTRRYPACNFKMVVDKQYGAIAVRKDGTYFDTVEIIKPQVDKNATKDSCVSVSSPGAIPVMGVYNLDNMRTNEFSQSSQEKLVLTMLNMSKLTPYYYTILQAIKRKPAPIDTMGVTEDTMYYDPKFVANLQVPELTFVLIHEMMHLAMQHSIRFGNRANHQIWNIATDLYINSIICNDFKCKFGQGVVDYKSNGKIKTPDFGIYIETIGEKIDLSIDTPETIYDKLMKENNNGLPSQQQQQSAPAGAKGRKGQKQQGGGGNGDRQKAKEQAKALVEEGMKQVQEGAKRAQQECKNSQSSQQAGNEISDGLKDVQEAVKDAMADNLDSAQNNAQSGLQQTQQGINDMSQAMQNSQQSGQQGSQGMTPQDQMQRGMNLIQQGLSQLTAPPEVIFVEGDSGSPSHGSGQNSQGQQGQSGQGQSGQGSSGGDNQSDSVADKSGQQGKGSGQQSSLAEDDFSGQGGYEPMQNVNVTYNGKKLTGSIMRDVMSNNGSKEKDAVQEKLDASRRALQTIITKIELEEKERGESLEKNAGLGAGLTRRYIEVGLSAGVDWRVLFRNICKDKPKKTFTLAQPNQDYMNMGMTLADRRRIGKPERVSNVKFAIDVSGSVSKKELMVTLSEINNIFNYFKLDGELIYWSTMIGDAGMFSSLKDMLKIEPNSTGGTDVRCVFDYLAGKTKVHGMTEKDRVRDMKAIFIITDGCFSMNFNDYAEMFGRRVVWLITGVRGNTITFNPPFGRVLALDIDND